MSAILNLKYFNSFWLKKMETVAAYDPTAGDPVNGPLDQSLYLALLLPTQTKIGILKSLG